MILYNKDTLTAIYFFLEVIHRTVLVAEAKFVAVSFEKEVHPKVISDHRVFQAVKLGVLNAEIRLHTRGKFLIFSQEISS